MVTKTVSSSSSVQDRGFLTRTVGGSPTFDSFENYVFTKSRSRTGSGVPNYKTKISQGLQAGSGFIANKLDIATLSSGSASCTFKQKGNPEAPVVADRCKFYEPFIGSSNFTVGTHISGTSTSIADNAALIQIREAVKAQQFHISGPTFLGEFKEVVQMLRNPASGILKGIDRYLNTVGKSRRGLKAGTSLKKRIKIVTDAAAETWLEVAFGLKPLIADCKGIAEAVARYKLDDINRHEKARGYGNHAVGQWHTGNGVAGLTFGLRIVDSKKTEVKIIYTCGIKAAMASEAFSPAEKIIALSGFNLQEFVPTLWNLCPWSFLVDYFGNIGECLEAWSTDTSSVSWVCKSTITETIGLVQATPYSLVNINTDDLLGFSGSSSIVQSTYKTIVRTLPTSLGLPTLEFHLDGSLQHLTNELALLMTRGRGFRF